MQYKVVEEVCWCVCERRTAAECPVWQKITVSFSRGGGLCGGGGRNEGIMRGTRQNEGIMLGSNGEMSELC